MQTNPQVYAYLGLGTNMGDREAHLRKALDEVGGLPGTTLVRTSPVYSSAAWGPVEQPDFLNMVAEISTDLQPLSLLHACKAIERRHGRRRGVRWGPRPLDIDILLYGDLRLNRPELEIPHPRIWERAFVLLPLSDLRPDLRGGDGRPIIEWLAGPDIKSQEVQPYPSFRQLRNEK